MLHLASNPKSLHTEPDSKRMRVINGNDRNENTINNKQSQFQKFNDAAHWIRSNNGFIHEALTFPPTDNDTKTKPNRQEIITRENI